MYELKIGYVVHMNAMSIITGYYISTLFGAAVLYLLIDKIAWNYLEKKGILNKGPETLTLPMGILERFLYTSVFIINQPTFIIVWLTLKVASHWKRWANEERGTYNVFLIGSALSLIIAFFGAWIALGHMPLESK